MMVLAFALVLLLLAVPSHADVGTYTVAQYRTWPEGIQTGYVSGAMGTLDRVGHLACSNPATVGVMMKWLESKFVKPSDNLAETIFNLSIDRHGCRSVQRKDSQL